MEADQQQNYHVCRFCKQGFSDGKQLEGHMRRHLALIATCKTKVFQEFNQERINCEKGFQESNQERKNDGDRIIIGKQGIQESDQLVNKSQREDDDHDGNNVYVLRKNPKRSWRVSNLGKDCDVSNGKESVCKRCGKVFASMKGLYGHMRCHSLNFRSRSGSLSSSSEKHEYQYNDGVGNLVRNKRLCTSYKSVKHDRVCSGDDEAIMGALCLMMLSRGVRSLEGVQLGLVRSNGSSSGSESGQLR